MLTNRLFLDFMVDYYKDTPLTGVEIGVYKGKNAIEMLDNLNIKKLYLIDPYSGDDGYKGGWRCAGADGNFDGLYNAMVKNLAPYKDRIEIIREKSSVAISKIPEVDFIYIDGNHEFECVKHDFHSYYPKVKSGGIVAGDNLEMMSVANVILHLFSFHNMKLNAANRKDSYEWWGIKHGNGV